MKTTYWIRVETNQPMNGLLAVIDEDESDTTSNAISIAKDFISQYCGKRPKTFKGTDPHDCEKELVFAEVIKSIDGEPSENNEWCSDWYYRKN